MQLALDFCEGVPLKKLKQPQQTFEYLAEQTLTTIDSAFCEKWRFEPCEREASSTELTAIFDHTLVETGTTDPAYWSGKHGAHGVKFLTVTTLQGTVINVIGPIPARAHDYKHCTMIGHVFNVPNTADKLVADLGYIGSDTRTVITPFRATKFGLHPLRNKFNKRVAVYRARVEHTFANIKRRFTAFAGSSATSLRRPGNQIQSDRVIGFLFKLACLAHSHHAHFGNRAFSKYRTCCNRYWRTHSTAPNYPPAGDVVFGTNIFPTAEAVCAAKKQAKQQERAQRKEIKAAVKAEKANAKTKKAKKQNK